MIHVNSDIYFSTKSDLMILNNIEHLSDKVYWHQFDEFYKKNITVDPKCILEIGIAKGDSIRLLRERYPLADIYGFDIIRQQSIWPVDEKIFYYQIDQGDVTGFRSLLQAIDKRFDLVIEDGSHDPLHQKISLIECCSYMNRDGVYVLEDLHTSLAAHRLYVERGLKSFPVKQSRFSLKKSVSPFQSYFGPLHCLLMLDFHFEKKMTQLKTESVDFSRSLFSLDELGMLFNKISRIDFFKRLRLPYYCYNCKKSNFNFYTLKCECGAELYSETDSMTSLLHF